MRHPAWYLWFGLVPLALACEGKLIEPKLPGPTTPPTSNPTLAFRFGGSGSDVIMDMVSDAAGNIYVAGTFTGTADFDPGAGVSALNSLGATDVFLAKYTSTGLLAWVSRVGGTGADSVSSLARDVAGNLYLGGGFEGSVDFDPTAGLAVLNSTGNQDGYVAKFSASGLLLWARRFGGPAKDAVADVAVDAAQNVYAAGTFAGQADALPIPGPTILSDGAASDGFLLALDAGGTVRYALPIGGTQQDSAGAVGVSPAGVVTVAGTFRGSADFARNAIPVQVASQGGADVFLASYSSAGVLIRTLDIGGLADQALAPGGLTVDATGGAAVLGTFAGATDFNPSPAIVSRTSIGATDVYLARFDANGVFLSVATIGGTGSATPVGLVLDASGDAVITGAFSGALDFDPSVGTAALTSLGTAGATDIFAARYTATGSFLWVSRMGESTSAADRKNSGSAVAVDPLGNLLLVGRFFGAPDLDPGSSAFRFTSFGDADGFVVKLTSGGALAQAP